MDIIWILIMMNSSADPSSAFIPIAEVLGETFEGEHVEKLLEEADLLKDQRNLAQGLLVGGCGWCYCIHWLHSIERVPKSANKFSKSCPLSDNDKSDNEFVILLWKFQA